MQGVEDFRLLGSKAEGRRRAALAEAEAALAEARLEQFRRQHRTISDRGQRVPPRAAAPVRRQAKRDARIIPVLGLREYRAGGTVTIGRSPC